MHERTINIHTPDGSMETFITHPEQDGPFAAVVLYMDVWGIREELHDIARRVATVGYYCAVPDFYYRQGRVRHEFRDANNRMISLAALPEADRKRVSAPLAQLMDTMVAADTGALLRFLDAGEPVRPGALGSIGYCMGGRHVMSVAAAFPDRFRASAGLHPTSLISDRPDSPHRFADRLRGEFYCGFAETDPHAPPSMIEELGALLAGCQVRYHSEIHAGAVHGYALPDRDIHHKRGANRDWELIFAMYRRQLGEA
ncbi:MAG: dienelactone hydrolase family protein [Acetobacteraceae bacterium]|nr:dienelactone hydrolase family protein [Acetobacteraceae bacterium]